MVNRRMRQQAEEAVNALQSQTRSSNLMDKGWTAMRRRSYAQARSTGRL